MKQLFGVLVLALAMVMGLAVPALMQPASVVQAAPVMAGEDGTRDMITPTNVVATGIAQSLSAASGDGHKFVNTAKEFVIVTNDYTDTVTLTVVTGGTADGFAIDDVDVTIAAGATKLVGPFATAVFNQRSGADAGRVYLNWDATVTDTVASSVTLNVYRLP
jgi:hypothetical protein